MSASVVAETGTALTDSHVVFADRETHEWYRADIDEDGNFSADLPSNTGYDVIFFHQKQGDLMRSAFDGVPVIADLDQIRVENEPMELGNYTVPEGFVTTIQVVDSNGNPLENVPLSFYTQYGAGTGPRSFTTNADGYVTHAASSEAGIELAGSMTIRTHPASANGELLDTIFVDEEKSLTVTLRNPEEYNGIVVHDDSGDVTEPPPETQTPPASDSTAQSIRTKPEQTAAQQSSSESSTGDNSNSVQRGFFSNGANEPEALSDPMNLTVGGFLLSVAGIVFQMVGGK
ncbi:Ig-like domain-containing protein [Haloarcula argentinensis]|uniref:PGF-CTERM sorting domain-containing protein n=1 Tax=Haloarcula argentinensis TaxID=43776 RepID=A0A847UG53_HALAR|nr:Ig-like domain-containing protein [Haloarcula argentinensis]NLV14753.1 hypothetical protein [Haloarcula argentinensis]